jgi:hypothetical protein
MPLVKTPSANLGDKWISPRRNKPGGEKWYDWISSLRLVQATGRSVRSNTDYGYYTMRVLSRSIGDSLPELSLPSDIKVSIIDYIVKIVAGALTFVLLAVVLRRKFERKYTR